MYFYELKSVIFSFGPIKGQYDLQVSSHCDFFHILHHKSISIKLRGSLLWSASSVAENLCNGKSQFFKKRNV